MIKIENYFAFRLKIEESSRYDKAMENKLNKKVEHFYFNHKLCMKNIIFHLNLDIFIINIISVHLSIKQRHSYNIKSH